MTTGQTILAPRDFEALRSLIIERRNSLPRRLAQVAKYALDNPDEVAFGTAASIAASAEVQPSTLVRFAHQMGYEGFSDLQKVFQAKLRDRRPSYEDRLKTIAASGDTPPDDSDLLQGFLTAARRSLDDFSASVDPKTLNQAVSILAGADTIYLLARRRSYPLIAHMAYAFGKLKIRNSLIASTNGIDPEIASMARPQDAALAISFSPYAADCITQAHLMSEAGVPVVAITDSAFSPLAACATQWLEIAEADYGGFRSLSASMALCTALPVAVAEARQHGA
ncbi:MurR/RpiR family transcriptional regulator [Hoeflea prorocentri]|uniref:MurR/RpiR family transcriptional regulator n=1 Tax=Hoeflea prorocentri TaxID=1922333 RepID=A0A9X3UIN6_9HYPH|nr:MurR/RpiR family transcriptional regulator [Hoeflea prorocentri]MCY6381311.1 MurR/RpiR family transcriptional regulator [Hoeflea prorocentri]MDA5399111.1 MurR/RpiR family transcriptional regulator [Hoeflea prorocentri]